jgi:hypothetical protein
VPPGRANPRVEIRKSEVEAITRFARGDPDTHHPAVRRPADAADAGPLRLPLSVLNYAAVRLGSALLTSSATTRVPFEKVLPELRAQSATHAFGKITKRRRREAAKVAGSVPG